MVNIRLESDFHDFYDDAFNPNGARVYRRMLNRGPNRIEAFNILTTIGLKTPKYGMVAELYKDLAKAYKDGKDAITSKHLDEQYKLVVYADIETHGDPNAMMLLTLQEAMDKYPGHFAAQYIEPRGGGPARSLKYIQVGNDCRWTTQVGPNWQSNHGADAREFGMSTFGNQYIMPVENIKCPIYSIDFVEYGRNEILAIDLNFNPKIPQMAIEMSQRNVVEQVAEFL